MSRARSAHSELNLTEVDMRLAISGTSCTGKTTLWEALKVSSAFSNTACTFIPEGARELLIKGRIPLVKMDAAKRAAFQRAYFRWKHDREFNAQRFFADRSFVDLAAVSLERDGETEYDFVAECRRECGKYTHVFYMPDGVIPFVEDGVRIPDPRLHKRVSERIQALLDEWGIEFSRIQSTTHDDRVEEVIRKLKELQLLV